MNKRFFIVMGLTLALPSTILGAFALVYILVEKGIINSSLALIIILLCIINIFFLIFKYARNKKTKS